MSHKDIWGWGEGGGAGAGDDDTGTGIVSAKVLGQECLLSLRNSKKVNVVGLEQRRGEE